MKLKVGRFLVATLLAGAGLASASSKNANTPAGPVSDADLSRQVTHELRMYPHYTMWDDLNFRVNNGQVELFGAVTEPYKKSDIEHIVQRVPGVTSVTDEIKVLPLSPADNSIRNAVARAIFRDPALSRYAEGAIPSIHIIVDNGHVTLTGFVATESDKDLAGLRANGAGLNFGVTNNLQVEHSSKKG
jgi:hyperosmotically inducible periplasmic protein